MVTTFDVTAPVLWCSFLGTMSPVTVCEDLSADIFSNYSSALQVQEDAADGGLLGTSQLLISYFASYSLQEAIGGVS